MEVTVDGLDKLEADLGKASAKTVLKVVATTQVAGRKIRDDARKFATGLSHAPAYPRSITADVITKVGSVEVQVGPDKNLPQGALGNILEFGTTNNAPHAHLGPAFDKELPEWIEHLGDAAGDIL